MLRKIRICLQVVMMTLVTLLLLGIGFRVHLWAGWVAKIQLIPAILAVSLGVLILILCCTAFFGRIYCSVVCPLGIMQDIFSWIGGKFKKNRFSYAKEKKILRHVVCALFFLAMIIGFAPVTTLIEPYSAYSRIVNSLFKPLYDLLNNWLASLDAANDRYNFTEVQIWTRSVTTFVVAIVTLVLLGALAIWKGRLYCNTICPAGTLLGSISRVQIRRTALYREKTRSRAKARRQGASCFPRRCSSGWHHGSHGPDPNESGRWLGRHRGQKSPKTANARSPSWLGVHPSFGKALHGLPTLRVKLPEQCFASFHRLDALHATHDVV